MDKEKTYEQKIEARVFNINQAAISMSLKRREKSSKEEKIRQKEKIQGFDSDER